MSKNYNWWLNPVWHKMLYSCTHTATVGVEGLTSDEPVKQWGKHTMCGHTAVKNKHSDDFDVRLIFCCDDWGSSNHSVLVRSASLVGTNSLCKDQQRLHRAITANNPQTEKKQAEMLQRLLCTPYWQQLVLPRWTNANIVNQWSLRSAT